MLRPKTTTCLLCSFRAAHIPPATTQQSRRFTQPRGERSRPHRMSLAGAGKVSAGNPREGPARRRQDGPFGGMNIKEANIRGTPERPSAMQLRRSDHKPGRRQERERQEDLKKEGGFKALKMQSALTPISYNARTSVKERMKAQESFDKFDLMKEVKSGIYSQALPGLEDVKPTPVQRIAIPTLLGEKQGKWDKRNREERQDFLIAAETGSGKTLSYLIPTINAVKLAEAADIEILAHEQAKQEEALRQNSFALPPPPLSNMVHPTTGRPRAIILVPTSELVTQVGTLVKTLSHTIKFRSAMISSAYTGKVIRNRLFAPSGIDVLISTPHLLSSIAESDPNILSRVTHLIVDEADSLLDRGFSPLTSAIMDRAAPSLKQLILCSATIPRSLDSFLRKRFPAITRLVTPNLHAIPRRVQLGVVDCERAPYQGNKDLACAETIWSIGKHAAEHDGPVKGEMDVKRVLVFVNEREKTVELADYLISKGVDAVALSRDTPEQRQTELLASFTTSARLSVPKDAAHPGSLLENLPNYQPPHAEAPRPKRTLPNMKVLVTTDLGSRGIDTLAVRTVVLYDVPHSTIDFIHRLGRTGRMGRRGRGIVLVGKGDRRDIVAEVKGGMFEGKALI